MAGENSLLMVHLMDGLGISKVASSGDIFVDFHLLRDNKVIKHWQSKHIRNSKLMVWDQKMEVTIEGNGALDDMIVRMSLLCNSTGVEGENHLIAILEELFCTFAAVGPISTSGTLTFSPAPSPMRQRRRTGSENATLNRKDRVLTLASVDPTKQGNPRIRFGVMYIPAELVKGTTGIDSKRNFMNFKFQENLLKQQQANRQSRSNSPCFERPQAAEDVGDKETAQMKEDREFKFLHDRKNEQRQRTLEETIFNEFCTIKLNISYSSSVEVVDASGVVNTGASTPATTSVSVVPIKTFVTLLQFHFPPKFGEAVDGAAAALHKEKAVDTNTGTLAMDGDSDIDAEAFSGQSPIQLLKLGYVHLAGQGRFFHSRVAWEYTKHCIDCNNRLIEGPNHEQLIESDDTLFIDSEQPSKASVLGLVLWVEKTVRQCQSMIEFLFADLNMEFALPHADGVVEGARAQTLAKGKGPQGSSAAGSVDMLTAPLMDILDPLPARSLQRPRSASRELVGHPDVGELPHRPPRPEPLPSSANSSHLSVSLDGPLSAANTFRSTGRSKSPSPAVRRSVDATPAGFDLTDDATLGEIMSDEKEALLQKNMVLVRDRLNYATKILTATMSVAGLPLDIQEKCAKCLRDVLSNCATLTAQIKVRSSALCLHPVRIFMLDFIYLLVFPHV